MRYESTDGNRLEEGRAPSGRTEGSLFPKITISSSSCHVSTLLHSAWKLHSDTKLVNVETRRFKFQ